MMLGQALKRLVLKYTAHTRLHPHYPFKLVKQNGDLTLELQPDSGDVPGFSNIPLRVPAPGTVMKLQPGTRAVLVFENGDRKAPVAIPLFDKDAGALLEHELHAQTKASLVAPDVRLGDTSATEQLMLGTTFRTAHGIWHVALATFIAGVGVLAAASGAAFAAAAAAFTAIKNDTGIVLAPTKDACTAAATACTAAATAATAFATLCANTVIALSTTFEGASPTYLSTTVKTR